MTKYDPLWAQGGSYNAREDRTLFANLWDEGVMDMLAFVVTERALGANFTVDISAGVAVVAGDIDADQGNYICKETAATTGTTVSSVPSAGNERYDRVVLEVRDDTEDSSGVTDWRFRVVAGPPASVGTGTVPAVPDHAISLAVIGPIVNSTTAITDSLITDDRTLAGERCRPATLDWRADNRVPSGWLPCDGSAVSRSTYARLFAHIGTSYNTGGEAGTDFRLPDLRGKVAVPVKSGQSQVDTIGETGGEYTHTLTQAETPLKSHSHPMPHTHTMNHDHPDIDITEDSSGASMISQYTLGGGTRKLAASILATVNVVLDAVKGRIPNYTGNTGPVSTANTTATSDATATAHNVMQPYQVVGLAVIRT